MTIKRIIYEPTFTSRPESQLLYYYLSKENNNTVIMVNVNNKNEVVDFIKKTMTNKKLIFDDQELILNSQCLENYFEIIVQAYLKIDLAKKFHVNKKDLSATLSLLMEVSKTNNTDIFNSLVSLRTTKPEELKDKLSVLQFDDSKQGQYLHSFVLSSIQNFGFFQQVIEFLYLIHRGQIKTKSLFPFQLKGSNNILIMTLNNKSVPLYKQLLMHVILNTEIPCYLEKGISNIILNNQLQENKANMTVAIDRSLVSKIGSSVSSLQEIDISLLVSDIDFLDSYIVEYSSSNFDHLRKDILITWLNGMRLKDLNHKYLAVGKKNVNLITVNNSKIHRLDESRLIQEIKKTSSISSDEAVHAEKSKRKLSEKVRGPRLTDDDLDEFGFPTETEEWY